MATVTSSIKPTGSTDVMLTTYDNPFNPFKDFDRWWKEDLLLGHDCCGLLARVANTSDIASDDVNDERIIEAMNEIVSNEPMIYKIVTEADYEQGK